MKEVLARRRGPFLLITPATKCLSLLEFIDNYWYKYVCLD